MQIRHGDGSGRAATASLLDIVRAALMAMNDAHCCYCDGHPLDATGEEQVDHFKPKSEFPHLVCTWSNLFLVCMACNKAKSDQWDEALLKPDEDAYRFSDYFELDLATGELRPNGSAGDDVQRRAERTIEVFALNRAGACSMRRYFWKQLPAMDAGDRAGMPYRFLAELYDDILPILTV